MGDVKFLKSEYAPFSLRAIEEELPPGALCPFATLGADERWLYDILSEAQTRADRLAADYCYEFGSKLVVGRRYRAAWAMLEIALEIYLGQPATDAEQVDRVLAALAKLLDSMVPAPDVVAYLERAWLIWCAVHGPEHTEVAEILNNLGCVRKRRAELDAARACYEQALAIWQEMLEPAHPYFATAYNNLGGVARAAGRPAEARRNYEKALALSRDAHGQQHPATATILTNLGAVCHDQDDDGAAGHYLKRALAILENTGLPAPRELAGTYNNLGHLLLAQKRNRQARRYFERALALYEEAPETTPTEIACVLNNLAAVSNAMGDATAAVQALGRAYLIQRRWSGAEHPHTVAVSESLQQVLAASGQGQRAGKAPAQMATTPA